MAELKRNEKIDIVELLKDLDKYEPRLDMERKSRRSAHGSV